MVDDELGAVLKGSSGWESTRKTVKKRIENKTPVICVWESAVVVPVELGRLAKRNERTNTALFCHPLLLSSVRNPRDLQVSHTGCHQQQVSIRGYYSV